MFASVKVESNSTTGEIPQKFRLYFGKDGQPEPVSGFIENFIRLDSGQIVGLEASDDNYSYLLSIKPDDDQSFGNLQISQPFSLWADDLSLWLDANDTSGGTYNFEAELTLWVDASDASTISKRDGSDDIENWHNKINPDVVLKSVNRSPPSFNETINGKTAVLIDEDNGNIERITAYLNGAKLEPSRD